MPVHFEKQVQVRALLFNKTFIRVFVKYSDYNNTFLAENIAELLENTRINKYVIKLKENKSLSFGLIYSLRPIELEILKTYMKINLVNGFI